MISATDPLQALFQLSRVNLMLMNEDEWISGGICPLVPALSRNWCRFRWAKQTFLMILFLYFCFLFGAKKTKKWEIYGFLIPTSWIFPVLSWEKKTVTNFRNFYIALGKFPVIQHKFNIKLGQEQRDLKTKQLFLLLSTRSKIIEMP